MVSEVRVFSGEEVLEKGTRFGAALKNCFQAERNVVSLLVPVRKTWNDGCHTPNARERALLRVKISWAQQRDPKLTQEDAAVQEWIAVATESVDWLAVERVWMQAMVEADLVRVRK